MAIAVLVGIALWDGLAPRSTAFEVDVLGVGASVNDINIDTLTAVSRVEVLVEGTEAQSITVRDAGKTPGSVLLELRVLEHVHLLIFLDVLDLRWESAS
ncbi:hypothetical protein Tdes44962_MAKER04185 [Teratosphaeria destructans]|uniref:Uncharacterized protein n=1 Tax=Teratosphaeria destructans TaxID=418781 RepID=A0A9W7SN17_9PEZI|nr:hypothetical protein Tdes44962_MAKER04185 [Teratosphaeria destructans]